MNNFDLLLQNIRIKPGLYLGEKSLSSLFFFILGYTLRAEELNHSYTYSLDGFEEFVHDFYKDITTNNWHGLILKHSQSQEEAFDKFYELLDEHLKLNDETPIDT